MKGRSSFQRRVACALALVEGLEAFCRRLEGSLRVIVRPRPPKRFWTAQEDQELRKVYPNTRTKDLAKRFGRPIYSVHNHAHALGLKKSDAFLKTECYRYNGQGGIAYRFPKGHKPWNAGMKGLNHPGSRRTQFKKGGKPLNTWKPIGTETVTKDGYLVRKVTDFGGYNNDDWKFVHHLVWEKRRGPVPPGHVLGFKNGNKRDFRFSNLVLRTFAENMRLNTIHRYPVELKKTIRALAKLRRTIRRKEDEED